MKKIAFIICCILTISLAACSNKQENTQSSKTLRAVSGIVPSTVQNNQLPMNM